jgi:serine/threonine protein kinase
MPTPRIVSRMLRPAPNNLAAHGTILGTFQYMAPEQLEAQDADARTDVFAFGAVVYEMVTGKKAFDGKSQATLIASILTADPPSLTQVQPLAPAPLDQIVRISLAKNPDARWQSMRDVELALRWIIDRESETQAPTHKTIRYGRKGIAAAVLL